VTRAAFEDQVAVVTGAGGGLGRVTAALLAARGASVAILDVRADAARDAAAEIAASGAATLGVACDVSDAQSVASAADSVLRHFGRCDVLINNAGLLLRGPLETHSVEDWDRVLGVNLYGCFNCSQHFGRSMLAAGRGAIVSIASTAVETPSPGAVAYCASKAAIVALTRQMALEWGPHGIRANAVSPGFMRTGMTRDVYQTPEVEQARARMVPLGRVADLHEVASVVAFLASDEAAYVNGMAVTVDGGFTQTLSLMVPRPTPVI
jgi:NAD(P)-dependent dehydrogenase (short-subunit alcohol dehydrogenase family)